MKQTHESAPNTTEGNPFIPASQNLPEITVKAVILALILVVVLAAANAYLGLKVGTTVAASIPAAVISMGVLRLFRTSNILENNIVQTAASAGEALVAGVAYILPALIILKYWDNFHYWETVLVAIIGGFLGVMFSVPLRRVLLAQKILRFPEGTAIGQVLKASAEGASGLKHLVRGGLVGGFISLCQGGFQFVASSMQYWFNASSFIYGIGAGFDPALIAAGYIVGINIAISSLLGVTVGWIIGIPVLTHLNGFPAGDASNTAIDMWHSHIRYMGVGTLLIGGLWTLITLIKPIIEGLRTSFLTVKSIKGDSYNGVPRTERDIPIKFVIYGILILLLPLILLFHHYISDVFVELGTGMQIVSIFMALIFVVCAGFILSAVSGYFAGLVGSTNSPGSALTLSALLLISLAILALFGPTLHFAHDPAELLSAAGLAIIISSVIGAASVITNETIQDLKAGQIVGATPWKQQVMLMIGVIVAAFVIPPVLQLLFNAYGIGGVFPHPGMDPSQMLAAPQAGLMAALTQGVFTHNLPWNMLGIGAIVAVFAILLDRYLYKKGSLFSIPVLAVGLGIYLPLDSSVPLIIGGFASFFIEKAIQYRYLKTAKPDEEAAKQGKQRGLILACGIVAGAALMGVLLAIPFAIAQSTNVLQLVPDSFTPIANCLAILVVIGLIYWLYQVTCRQTD